MKLGPQTQFLSQSFPAAKVSRNPGAPWQPAPVNPPTSAPGPAPARAPRVVLADGDPISRQVLGSTLCATGSVRLVAAMDSRTPVREWPQERPDLAILVAGPEENHVRMAQELVASEISPLLIGVDWTRHRLDAAFASGVAGCLSKQWAIGNLAAAANAAAAGYVVLSPDLVRMYVSGLFSTGGPTLKAVSDGRSLDSMLGGLTVREREVLTRLAEGMSTTEVSDSLAVSPATVKSHVSHSLAKLGVRNRLEAVLLMQAALGCGVPSSASGIR